MWKVDGRLHFPKNPTQQRTKMSQIEIRVFRQNFFLDLSDLYYLEPGLHLSITDIVEGTNTLIHDRHNHS